MLITTPLLDKDRKIAEPVDGSYHFAAPQDKNVQLEQGSLAGVSFTRAMTTARNDNCDLKPAAQAPSATLTLIISV